MNAFLRPKTLETALATLSEGPCRFLAGGTDVYPVAGARLSGRVIDLMAIPALSGISLRTDLRIGACTTWSAIAAAHLPPACRALRQAARQVGGRQIQNAGTIGGNLCNASPAADGIPPLLALDAEVELTAPNGQRRLPLEAFLIGPRKTALAGDEILTAIIVPEKSLSGTSAFVKLGARSYLVISIAMVAARISVSDGILTDCALAVGACSATARRLTGVEEALIGMAVGDAIDLLATQPIADALAPIDDVRATAEYRGHAAAELLRRALTEASR